MNDDNWFYCEDGTRFRRVPIDKESEQDSIALLAGKEALEEVRRLSKEPSEEAKQALRQAFANSAYSMVTSVVNNAWSNEGMEDLTPEECLAALMARKE